MRSQSGSIPFYCTGSSTLIKLSGELNNSNTSRILQCTWHANCFYSSSGFTQHPLAELAEGYTKEASVTNGSNHVSEYICSS